MNMIDELIATYSEHAQPDKALQMAQYMKNRFSFLGLPAPLRRALSRPFLSGPEKPAPEKIPHIVQALWTMEHREYQYYALDLMMRNAAKAPVFWIETYESCIVQKSWWDTVDGLAASCVGPLFSRHGYLTERYVGEWMDSGNLWLQRTCLLFQLKYKGNTDVALLEQCIENLSHSREFFIQKAIGWALRTYSKTDAPWVRSFIENSALAPLSRREALRLLE